MDKRLEKIFSDKKSGSTELALRINKYLITLLQNPMKIKAALPAIKQQMSSFNVVVVYLEKVEKYLSTKDFDELSKFMIGFSDQLKNSTKKIYTNAKNDLMKLKTVLTLSNSRTISEMIRYWHQNDNEIRIIIAESRPKMEGRLMARELLKHGINVDMIIDSAITDCIRKADAVIIGADKILKNGNVINKCGSSAASIICNYYKKSFYVFSSRYKYVKEDHFSPAMQDEKEVWKYDHPQLVRRNYYFEEVDGKLITKIFTDD